MRKVWLASFAAIFALNAAPAADPAQPSPVQPASAQQADTVTAPELKKLHGFWKPQSVLFDQTEQMPDAKTRALLTLVVEGSEFRTYYCTDPKKDMHFRLFTADLTLDPAAHTFELLVRDGQKKGERRHGIYEVSANTLKLCYGPIDKPRPTAFAAPKGSGIFYETWALEKR